MGKYFQPNKKYMTISIYALVVIVISACFIKILISLGTTFEFVGGFIYSISPFLIGFFIAFIMNPIINFFDRNLSQKLLKVKNRKVSKLFSIFFSYIIVLFLLIVSIIYVIPQIIESLKDLVISIQNFIPDITQWANNIENIYPELDLNIFDTLLDEILPSITKMLETVATSVIPAIYGVGRSVVVWVLNIIIAVIVSLYVSIDKRHLLIGAKRIIYAILPSEKAFSFTKTLRECCSIFTNFIVGKSLDSLIIGILCFIIMSIFQLKYALLISLIVGITNMIPYFGPFIGAIPGILILLMTSPKAAITFAIIIIILQQFDGLFLGPKILGDSTGLRPMWIIFAITFGGWVYGPIGMFLGVPFVAVISYLCEIWINKRLKNRGLHIPPYSEQKKVKAAD